MSQPELGELLGYKLIGLRLAIDSLEMDFARTAAEFAGTDEYDEQGSTSPIDWIRHNCHMTSVTAGAAVAVGKNLEQLPESVQAVRSGEIGFAHLAVMARTANASQVDFKRASSFSRRGRARRASSITPAVTSATRPIPRVMPPSRPSKSKTAASL